jgi:CRISPR-associated endonuclease Csn1
MDGANLHTSLTIQNKNEYFEKSIENVGRSKATGKLIHVFQVGQKVLFIDKNVILEDFETSELSKKLYFVKRLADAAQGLVQFQHHLEARSDTELREAYGAKGVNGFSKFDENDTKPRLLLSVSNMNFLIEDIDFSFDSVGRILRLSL